MNEEMQFQKEQLEMLIQNVGEELNDALEEMRMCKIDSKEFINLKLKVDSLGSKYDSLCRLYDNRFNKPEPVVEPKKEWYDKVNWTDVAKTGIGTTLLFAGDYIITKQIYRWQNQGDYFSDRNRRNTVSGFLKRLF